jgi:hypothetical protein
VGSGQRAGRHQLSPIGARELRPPPFKHSSVLFAAIPQLSRLHDAYITDPLKLHWLAKYLI